jgi:hypothetical protein
MKQEGGVDMCDSAGRDHPLIGPLTPPYEDRYPIVQGGVMTALHRCDRCGKLYVSVAYDPWGGFHYLVLWPYGEDRYREVAEIDYGTIVHLWHAACIHEAYSLLPAPKRHAIDQHREKTTARPHPVDAPLRAIDITRYFDFTPPSERT